ncbi:MAG: GHKL domain-containing protein [Lachnospiraceae bacterium]|nr:GHKL domain-containing protein [Lachnospiraceae bacterium]
MRHSLKLKISLLLSMSMFMLVFLCWIANDVFLPSFYEKSKISSLSEVYDSIDRTIGDNAEFASDNDILSAIEKIENSYGVNVYIISTKMSYLFFEYPITSTIDGNAAYGRFTRNERIVRSLQRYMFGEPEGVRTTDLLKTVEDKYDVYKSFDDQVDSNFIDLVGYISNQKLIFVRTNYSNIEESAVISNKFLAISGGALVILCSILMYIFSYGITKPILDLSEISKEMCELKFETRYTGKRKDEIGELGKNINTLSSQLEKTISELKTANIELEKDIAKKTEVDSMRREFLSNVSHELKTPIALIQGYAEGLADNINDDEESRKFYCDVIVDEAQKMNKMVKKLLSLNELEFGNSGLELTRFDIVELVRSVASSIEVLAKNKEVSIVFNESEPIYVWADEYRVEEVITNYLSNALNHCSGSKIVDISFKQTDKKVRVSVFNSGEQIPDTEIEHIWDKFYKIDKARTREYGGSGIGLSIVKAIMEAHNEKFGVINHQAGVEFWFELTIE